MTQVIQVYRRSELEAIKPAADASGCLFRYKAIWLDGVDDTTDVALIGIGFHAISHVYILKLVDAKIGQDYELAQEAYVEGIAEAQTPNRLLPELSNLWKWHSESFELPLERFIATEERGVDSGVAWTPDLVLAHPERNALEVVDFKSGWAPPLSVEELKTNFQARVYSRYSIDRWPHFSAYEFTINAVRFRKRVTVSFTPQELDAVDLEVRAAIATIEDAKATNRWPAIPGPSCNWCTLDCPIADQDISVPKRFSVEQYQKVGEWLLVAEKQLRAVKKAMKAACAVHGPCNVNGVVFDNRPQVSKSYPMDAVLDVLKVRGVMGAFEGSTGLTFSQSALAKLFKAYPMLETDLSGVVQTKTSYKFSAKQAGVEDEDE
jgi:hypothetical protein